MRAGMSNCVGGVSVHLQVADHAHEPLSETAAYDTRLRLSSCRIHSTVRFQLALFLIRQSRVEPQVLLFYKAEATKRWTCAVAKRLADSGFLITAYPTDAIKEGVRIWPK